MSIENRHSFFYTVIILELEKMNAEQKINPFGNGF